MPYDHSEQGEGGALSDHLDAAGVAGRRLTIKVEGVTKRFARFPALA